MMVHLPFAALTALLVATSAVATNTNTGNEPAINNLVLSPFHSTTTNTNTNTDTHTPSTSGTTTNTTNPIPGGPFAHIIHKLDEATSTMTEVQHHRIVTPTEERTGPPTETGPPFEETLLKGGFGAAAAAAGAAAADVGRAANDAGRMFACGGGVRAAAVVAAVAVMVGMVVAL